MKIFLAGATGAVGRLLVPLLLQAGHEVAGTTRSPDKTAQIVALGARPIVADALDRESMFAALETERPDVVIHQLTDLSSRDFAGNANLRIVGTRNLVDASLAVGVGRMIAQSISWICVAGHGPSREDDALDLNAPPPRGNAVAATHSLEQAVAEMPVGVVLRYGLFYGPGTWYARNGLTTEQVRRGELKATDGISSFIHVADAAQAALLALDWPAGVVNIVDDEPAAGTEWLPLYAYFVGAPPPKIVSGAAAWERGASNFKARQLGWTPQFSSWREGFKTVLT
jgi:nucleoside-diphosphate-sugar epimerase